MSFFNNNCVSLVVSDTELQFILQTTRPLLTLPFNLCVRMKSKTQKLNQEYLNET